MEPANNRLKPPKPWAKIKLSSFSVVFSSICHTSKKRNENVEKWQYKRHKQIKIYFVLEVAFLP
jgi:hypothetical protein